MLDAIGSGIASAAAVVFCAITPYFVILAAMPRP
jgi:hypothetical protein